MIVLASDRTFLFLDAVFVFSNGLVSIFDDTIFQGDYDSRIVSFEFKYLHLHDHSIVLTPGYC